MTLAELLVIVLMLGLALAAAVPWVLGRREAARRDVCAERQRRLGAAVLEYDGRFGRLPGYVNRAAADRAEPAASWAVAIFPFSGEEALARQWRQGDPQRAYLPGLVCPLDPVARRADRDAALSYVANCGRLPKPAPGTGLFFDRRDEASAVSVSLRELEAMDGAETTLLLSENLQAGRWSDTTIGGVGMGWWERPEPCSLVNGCREAARDTQQLRLARPSSFHPGGVNATYADGRGAFLAETIDYRVLAGLMAADDRRAGLLSPDDRPEVP